ncbi:MAG TPA: hypothetical protein VFE90_25120 [Myxococcales bacterium]|jgi:hypothetical protein|nr:hypothetical protein [Myxococcales bacterium]
MATTEPLVALETRARRAYELGRLRRALRLVPLVLAGAAAALACGRSLSLTCALCAVLLALAVGLSHAGGSPGRAVIPGLLAGALALAFPVLLHVFGDACVGPACRLLGVPSCIVGGASGGVFIASRLARDQEGASFAVAALTIAFLMGAFGCSIAGVGGVLGMIAGILAAGAPALLAFRR